MPVYEYRCRTCENHFEVLTSIKDRDKVKCPQCQSADVAALLSLFSTKTLADRGGPGPCQGCSNQQCGNFPR